MKSIDPDREPNLHLYRSQPSGTPNNSPKQTSNQCRPTNAILSRVTVCQIIDPNISTNEGSIYLQMAVDAITDHNRPSNSEQASQPNRQSIHLRQRSKVPNAPSRHGVAHDLCDNPQTKATDMTRILRDGLLRAALVSRLDGLQTNWSN